MEEIEAVQILMDAGNKMLKLAKDEMEKKDQAKTKFVNSYVKCNQMSLCLIFI